MCHATLDMLEYSALVVLQAMAAILASTHVGPIALENALETTNVKCATRGTTVPTAISHASLDHTVAIAPENTNAALTARPHALLISYVPRARMDGGARDALRSVLRATMAPIATTNIHVVLIAPSTHAPPR